MNKRRSLSRWTSRGKRRAGADLRRGGLGVLSPARLQYASTLDRYNLMETDSIDEVLYSFESL